MTRVFILDVDEGKFGLPCRTMASPDLLWQLVKKNNSFLVKRNGNNNASVQFSSEPNNLYNLNTFKYSGERRTHPAWLLLNDVSFFANRFFFLYFFSFHFVHFVHFFCCCRGE